MALERAGSTLSLKDMLDLQLAHAKARDAVHQTLDTLALEKELASCFALPILKLQSGAKDRSLYLRRPDLGRSLNPESRKGLSPGPYDLALVLTDGLSAKAVRENAPPVLHYLLEHLDAEKWKLAPLCLVEQGRVAVGDEIGEALEAQTVVVLLGERPGLSSPESLGIYVTWNPRRGRNDAERNCISNIHSNGLTAQEGAQRLLFYLEESRRLQLTGVDLKYRNRLLSE